MNESVIERGEEDVRKDVSLTCIPFCICQGASNHMHKYAYASMQIDRMGERNP